MAEQHSLRMTHYANADSFGERDQEMFVFFSTNLNFTPDTS